jgi:hypothetical protein
LGAYDRFALPARELLAHTLDDLPATRRAFERFGDDLAELAQAKTAAFAASAGRKFDNALDRQIVGQFARAPRRAGAFSPSWLRAQLVVCEKGVFSTNGELSENAEGLWS